MFGSAPTTGASLGRSASFSFSQPPANKPFAGSSGGFSFGGGATAAPPSSSAGTTQNAAAPGGGFSFGAKPATGGGLFGSAQPTQSTGLFGNTQSQQQQQPTSGLFGSSNQQTQQTTAATGGLFGKPAAGGFSFGAPSNTSAAGGFGSSNTNAGLFGNSNTFGQTQPQQQQAQQPQQLQQQQSQSSPFYRYAYYQKERFNDLPEDAKKLVEELDRFIGAQSQVRDELKTKDFGAEIRRCAAEWQELDSALKSLSATLESDLNQAKDVAQRLEQDRADNATLYSIADNAKDPRSDGSAFADWLRTYFQNLSLEYRDRIARYRTTMDTIQRHLQSLDNRETYTPQAISDVIHAQHASFMALAADVASLHSEIESLKKDYAKWYKQAHKSVRDPFGSMNQLAGSVPQ